MSWKKFIIFYEPKPAVNRSVLHLTDNRKSAPVKNGFQASWRQLQLRLRQAAQQKVSLLHETGFLSLLIDYCTIFWTLHWGKTAIIKEVKSRHVNKEII